MKNYVDDDPMTTPPRHVNCRCTLLKEPDMRERLADNWIAMIIQWFIIFWMVLVTHWAIDLWDVEFFFPPPEEPVEVEMVATGEGTAWVSPYMVVESEDGRRWKKIGRPIGQVGDRFKAHLSNWEKQ